MGSAGDCGTPPVPSLESPPGGTEVVVLSVPGLRIDGVLQLSGTRPSIILVYGDAFITGLIDLSAPTQRRRGLEPIGPGPARWSASTRGMARSRAKAVVAAAWAAPVEQAGKADQPGWYRRGRRGWRRDHPAPGRLFRRKWGTPRRRGRRRRWRPPNFGSRHASTGEQRGDRRGGRWWRRRDRGDRRRRWRQWRRGPVGGNDLIFDGALKLGGGGGGGGGSSAAPMGDPGEDGDRTGNNPAEAGRAGTPGGGNGGEGGIQIGNQPSAAGPGRDPSNGNGGGGGGGGAAGRGRLNAFGSCTGSGTWTGVTTTSAGCSF
jgi:hypothetical protein